MPLDDPTDEDAPDNDAVMAVDTARRGQQLICEGWFASHADSGTPGPHVHLRTSDAEPPVLRTDQLPSLFTAVTAVAERIDRLWAIEGDQYAAEVVLRSPDPQDPRVIEQRHRKRLRFTQAVLENLPEVMHLLTEAENTDEALLNVAALLDVDEVDVMVGLARFDLLTLTRPATERRLRMLAGPEDQRP
jgi:hypothetical protein